MPRIDNGPLARLSTRHPWQILKNLLGGAVIFLVWLALWAWLAAGVVRPLSTVPALRASVDAVERA
jgi:hypothetical protein